MKKVLQVACGSGLILVATVGCHRPVRSSSRGWFTKAKPAATAVVPGGTLTLAFTRKIHGTLELSLDGTRIPVKQVVKGGKTLVVKGVPEGRHRYFIQSPRDAFGPDQAELDMSATKGVYYVVFAQRFDAELYGKSEPTPLAEGMAGVSAELR